MSFELTIPQAAHADLSQQIASKKNLKHVTPHENNHPGIIRDPSGLVMHYYPIAGTDRVKVEIAENPHDVPESHIKTKLEEDLAAMMGQ